MPIFYDWLKLDQSIANKKATQQSLIAQCEELIGNTAELDRQAIALSNIREREELKQLINSSVAIERRDAVAGLSSSKRHRRSLVGDFFAAVFTLFGTLLLSLARMAGAAPVNAIRKLQNRLRGKDNDDN